MARHASGRLADAVHRELRAARARLETLSRRRLDLERDLGAARAAEDAARQALAAFEALANQTGDQPAPIGHAPETRSGGAAQAPPLAGAALREAAARVALQRGAINDPTHWRTWLAWLNEAGHAAAGKRPEATFLTQLARSPLVRRSPADGVYVLDLSCFTRERDELRRLHDELGRLPAPDQLAMLGDAREQRRRLQLRIARSERAVEEMWRVLSAERPPHWTGDRAPTPDEVVDAWLPPQNSSQQERLVAPPMERARGRRAALEASPAREQAAGR